MSEVFVIRGGHPLSGTVNISGSKNAAVAILPAVILAKGTFTLYNVPVISDIGDILDILEYLGAEYTLSDGGNTVSINTRNIGLKSICSELGGKIRASYYFWGALLARFGHSDVCPPGGCRFADRPFDMHVSAFNQMGAVSTESENAVVFDAPDGLKGAEIRFSKVSVGATINVMLAAVGAEGVTKIRNAAREPHVVDVANFLSLMGADIIGAGTDNITIRGGRELHSVEYTIVPDQIEAGTFLTAAAATRGNITVHGAEPVHLESIVKLLRECGCEIETDDNNDIHLRSPQKLRSCVVQTDPHPGFPTDMQAMFSVLFTTCEGTGIIKDTVFPGRDSYVLQLERLGAIIYPPTDEKNHISVKGPRALVGTNVEAKDLRAGAALVIAGLIADGLTRVYNIHYIDRGYENFVDKLKALGADIIRTQIP